MFIDLFNNMRIAEGHIRQSSNNLQIYLPQEPATTHGEMGTFNYFVLGWNNKYGN